jgi:hypothetical protein
MITLALFPVSKFVKAVLIFKEGKKEAVKNRRQKGRVVKVVAKSPRRKIARVS